MAAVTAMHLRLTATPELAHIRPIDDIDAEFLRIIEHERLRDAWPTPKRSESAAGPHVSGRPKLGRPITELASRLVERVGAARVP